MRDRDCRYYHEKLGRYCENALLMLKLIFDFPWTREELELIKNWVEKKLEEELNQ